MKKRFSPYPVQTPYLFLAPFLVVFAVFLVYPLLQSVLLSMEQTFGPKHIQFVFLDNFRNLFSDPRFFRALSNTAIYAAASVFLQLPLSLALALLLNRDDVRGRAFFRLIFFSPALVGAVFVGVMFAIIFQRRTGLLNMVLHQLIGWDLDFPWLQEYVMTALVLASLWMWTGFNMVYFLAALQNVDKDLTDAAHIDGAGPWQRFVHVTLPAIRPVGGFVLLLSMIGSFQLFELPYLLLGNTAGPQDSGLTIVMYLYQTGFEVGDLGYASAIGWVLAVILVGLAMVQRRLSREESY